MILQGKNMFIIPNESPESEPLCYRGIKRSEKFSSYVSFGLMQIDIIIYAGNRYNASLYLSNSLSPLCSPLPTKNTSTIDAHMSYHQNSSFSAKDQVNRLCLSPTPLSPSRQDRHLFILSIQVSSTKTAA